MALNVSFSWNLILLLIMACSVTSFAIFFERLYTLKSHRKIQDAFLNKIQAALEVRDFSEAIKICDETGGFLPHIVKAGLLKNEKERLDIEQAIELQSRIEIAELEKSTKILPVIAHVAPLIGLFGTVIGFIQAFSEMRLSGLMDIDAARIGEALEFALITTAAGLAVAIPSVIAFHYLASRIEQIILETEASSLEIVDLMLEKNSL